MAIRTWSALIDRNWSDILAWDGGLSVPTGTDTVTFDATSVKNCTIDNVGTWNGGPFNMNAGYTGTITQNVAFPAGAFTHSQGTFTGGSTEVTCSSFSSTGSTVRAFTAPSVTMRVNGSFTASGSNLTFAANSGTISMEGTGSLNAAIVTFNKVTFNGSGDYTINSATVCPLGASPTTSVTTTGSLTISGDVTASGTWTHTGGITLSSTGTISGGVTTINLTPAVAAGWTCNASATIPSGLNIGMSCGSGTAMLFSGGSKTYGTFTRTGTGSSKITFSGSNTFTTFQDNDGSVAHTLTFDSATTQTLTTWTVDGSSGKLVTINSAVTNATLTKSGGPATSTYLSISQSTVDASPSWTATNSTNGGSNVNWIFNPVSMVAPLNFPVRGHIRVGPAVFWQGLKSYLINLNQAAVRDTNYIQPTYPSFMVKTGPTVYRLSRINYLINLNQAAVTDTKYIQPTYPASKKTGPMVMRVGTGFPVVVWENHPDATDTNYQMPTYARPGFLRIGPSALHMASQRPNLSFDGNKASRFYFSKQGRFN